MQDNSEGLEINLFENNNNFKILYKIIKAGNATTNINSFLEEILRIIINFMSFDGGGIYIISHSSRIAEITCHEGLPLEFINETKVVNIDKKPYSTIFLEGKPIFTENYPDLNHKRAEKWGFLSFASIPLLNQQQVIGALNVASKRRLQFTDNEINIFKSIINESETIITKLGMENSLIQSKQNFQAIFESINDFLFVLDLDGTILQINPTVISRLKYPKEELLNQNVLMVHPPKLRPKAREILTQIISGESTSCDIPLMTKNGDIIEVETKVSRGLWNNNNVLIGVSRDISERKKIESELIEKEKQIGNLKILESELRYRNILENTNEGYYETDLEGEFIFLNEQFYLMFNITKVSLNRNTNLLSNNVKNIFKSILTIDNVGKSVQQDINLIDSTPKFIEISIFLRFNTAGEKVGYCGITRDISEQIQSESKILESELKLRTHVRELNCLYGISKLIEAPESLLHDIIHGTLYLIPFAWENPELFIARIYYGDNHYIPDNYKETDWVIEAKQDINDDELKIKVFSTIEKKFSNNDLIMLTEIAIRLKNVILQKISESNQKLSEEKYRSIIESIKEGYYEVDLKGKLIFFNQALSYILNYNNDELYEKNFLELLDMKNKKLLSDAFKEVIETGNEKRSFAYEIKNKYVEMINVESSITLKYDSEGNKIGFHGLIRDITERRNAERLKEEFNIKLEKEVKKKTQKLNEALAKQNFYINQIMKSSQFKTEFMSTMSHELRTPLNSIIGFSELLLEEAYGILNQEQNEFLNDIKNSADHLLEMINHILDISKIEAGKLSLKKEKFQLNSMIEQIKGSIKPLYQKKELEFFVSGLKKNNEIYADPIRFKEIMLNLLSNAIKFTLDGVISLAIEEQHDHFVFKVKDTGIGIARKDFNLIFKDFRRIDSPIVNSIPGSGLGLSLTKRLINLHGGEISFFSILGKGTTFTFTIPK